MKIPISNHDDNYILREALRRDAALVQVPPFDAAAHDATMRRIRALPERNPGYWGWRWMLPCAAGAGGLVLWILVVQPDLRPPTHDTLRTHGPVAAAMSRAPRVSAWAYQLAAAEGDEALLVMLDRDARTLLPPSPSPFSSPLE